MARAPRKAAASIAEEVQQAVSEALEDDAPEGLDESELATDDFLSAFLDDTEAKVCVYRVVEGQRRKPWLFNCSPVDTPYEAMMAVLRDEYAGGAFNITVRRDGRIVRNTTVEVEAPAPKGSALPQTTAPPASGDGPGDGGLAAVVGEMSRMMMDGLDRIAGQTSNQFKMLLEVMKHTSGGSQAPPLDPVAMQNQLLEGVAKMQKLAGGGGGDGEGRIELFMRALEIGRDLNRDSSDSSANDVLMEGLRQFAPLITRTAPEPGAEPPAAAGAPAAETPALPAPSAIAENPAAVRVAQVARLLCQMASENRDPDLYAEIALDQLGAQTALGLFADPASLDQLARLGVAEVVNFRPWFATMGASLVEIVQQSVEDEPSAEPPASGADPALPDGDLPGPGGDPSDAAGDGAAGGGGEAAAGDSPEGAGADGSPTA